VPAVPVDTTPEDLCDWHKMCAVIADASPWWEPGTRTGYHPQTFGYILGEIVRRATGQPIAQVLRERVAGPLGVADELFFGVPATELARVAHHEEPEGGAELTAELLAEIAEQVPFFRVVDGWKAAPPAALPSAAHRNRTDVLSADIPAGGRLWVLAEPGRGVLRHHRPPGAAPWRLRQRGGVDGRDPPLLRRLEPALPAVCLDQGRQPDPHLAQASNHLSN
jgi:CubicO group peptidase (beta-lactamase class C family)